MHFHCTLSFLAIDYSGLHRNPPPSSSVERITRTPRLVYRKWTWITFLDTKFFYTYSKDCDPTSYHKKAWAANSRAEHSFYRKIYKKKSCTPRVAGVGQGYQTLYTIPPCVRILSRFDNGYMCCSLRFAGEARYHGNAGTCGVGGRVASEQHSVCLLHSARNDCFGEGGLFARLPRLVTMDCGSSLLFHNYCRRRCFHTGRVLTYLGPAIRTSSSCGIPVSLIHCTDNVRLNYIFDRLAARWKGGRVEWGCK